jgi:hypothetical protein
VNAVRLGPAPIHTDLTVDSDIEIETWNLIINWEGLRRWLIAWTIGISQTMQ